MWQHNRHFLLFHWTSHLHCLLQCGHDTRPLPCPALAHQTAQTERAASRACAAPNAVLLWSCPCPF